MNRIFLTAGLAIIAAISFTACQREELPAEQDLPAVPQSDPITISAGFEQSFPEEAKTHLKEGSKIWWSTGDNTVYVFDSQHNKNKFTSDESGQSETRSFTGTITAGSTIEYILWTGKSKSDTDNSAFTQTPGGPTGNESVSEGDAGYIEWDYTKSVDFGLRDVFTGVNIPATQQIGTTNTFAFRTNVAIMKKGDKALRSVCGFIRFTIPDGIQSVAFHADQSLAGNIQIDYTGADPITTIVEDGNQSQDLTVNMYYRNNDHYEGGTLFAVLPAGTYSGFTITVTPASGTPFTLATSRDVTIVRGKYTDAGNLPSSAPAGKVLGQVVQVLPKNQSVGGIYFDASNKRLYVGYGGTIEAYDVTTPMQPKLLGSGSILGNPRQMMVYNNLLYVTTRESGAWIYSMANLLNKGTITLVKRYDSVEFATGLDVAGGAMFLGERQNGVEFVDVHTSSDPRHIRMIKTDESQSVFYRNGYLYSGEWSGGCVSIFDAHDLSNIQLLKTVRVQGYGDGVWISDNYLYVSTGHNWKDPSTGEGSGINNDGAGHAVEIWSVADPENPEFLSRTAFDPFFKSGADWWLNRPNGDNTTLFCGDTFGGLYVLDIHDKSHPEILEHYALNANPQTGGNSVNSIALGNGVVYLATSGYGLQAIKCSLATPSTRDRGTLPTNPTARYNYTTSSSRYVAWKPGTRGAVRGAAYWQGFLFVACGDAGLKVLVPTWSTSGNWWNQTTNVSVSAYSPNDYHDNDLPTISFAGGVVVKGNRLYVAKGPDGIGVYRLTLGTGNGKTVENGPIVRRLCDIKADLSPETKYQFSNWVTVPSDDYLMNASRYGSGYQFIAVGGTETAPTFTYRGSVTQNLNYMRYIPDQVCGSGRLPYATRDGLIWMDLSSPESVGKGSLISDIKCGTTCGVTHFRDGNALITNGNNAYLVASGSGAITQTVSLGKSGLPRWDGSNTLILTDFQNKKIHKIDVSNLSSPSVTYSEDTTGNPEPAIFVDYNGTMKAVVPCGYQGLLIEK